MADDHELGELATRVDALGERLAANEQLREAWAQVDDHFEALRVAFSALARAESTSDKVGLKARWNTQLHLLNSSLSIVETMALRLADSPAGLPAESGPRRVETLMASITSASTAADELQQGLREIEDLELRRLTGALGDHLRRARLTSAELERYHKRVYGKGDRGKDQ